MNRLTREQQQIINTAARPLSSDERSKFMSNVMQRLNGFPVLGPGLVHRVVAQAQRETFSHPLDGESE